MSPTLITLAILAGLAIGAYAYFADNWQFWKSSNSVPIHWGFVQSWARGWKGRRHQVNFTKNATVDAGLQAKEWERIKREGFEPPRKTTNDPEKLAADLSKEGWITSLSGTADGFKVITRGAEVAYVQFEVWEKMVASKWHKVRSKGSRFLPVSNPLGDTAAHMERARPFGDYHDMPILYNSSFRHISPRHKKGGSRGL